MDPRDRDASDSNLRHIVIVIATAVLGITGGLAGYEATRVFAEPSLDSELEGAHEAIRQEHERSQQLERQLAAAQAASLADGAGQAQELADLHKALEAEKAGAQEQRTKAEAMVRDLAAARSDLEAQSAAFARAGEQTSQAQKDAERAIAGLRQAITEERARTKGLTRDLAAARQENQAQAAALRKTAEKPDDTGRLAELQQALAKEQMKTDKLTRDLAAARQETERQTAALKAASDQPSNTQQTEASRPAPRLGGTAPETQAQAFRVQPAAIAVKTEVAAPSVRADVQPAAPPSPIATEAEARHLMTRARRFVEQRNISAAREMFERAADAGHPPALFGLAETYDPNMLAAWETIGTQGDVARAKALYAKALGAGMAEAQARLKALTQASGGDTR
jgi:hypothetical protein